MDVNAIDLSGAPADLVPAAEEAAAANVKRTIRGGGGDYFDPTAQSPYAITDFMEMKTVWHPMGA